MSTPTGNTSRIPEPTESANNGNGSPPNELHLIDSLSDINLSPNAVTHFNRFLSARNSLELHRDRRRSVGHRSLPCMFGAEDYDALKEPEEDGSGPSSAAVHPDPSTRNITGKSVDWADLHSSHGYELLHQELQLPTVPGMSNEALPRAGTSTPAPADATASRSDATASPPLVSLLTKTSGKFGVEESSIAVDLFQEKFAAAQKGKLYPFDTTGFPGSEISGFPLVPGSVPVGAFGQSPIESRSRQNLSLGRHDSTAPSIINQFDGLDLTTPSNLMEAVPRAALLETNNGTNQDIFGNMVEYNTISLCHTPINGQYCNLPYDYYSNINQPKSVPVYYQENQQSQIQPTDEKPPYDTDDEFLEPDRPPELILRGPQDLPIPTPENVARTVSPDLHPLIAKTYKKDCRTWLWKSARQRSARLAQQEEDEQNGMLGLLKSTGGGGHQGAVPASGYDQSLAGITQDLNRMNLG